MAVTFFLSCLLLVVMGSSADNPGYLITIPRSLKANTMERICISFEGSEETEGQTADIVFTFTNTDTNATTTYHLNGLIADGSSCSEFPVPQLTGKYSVSLLMTTSVGEEFTHEAEVEVQSTRLLTLVQTDKPMYKPGQTVKFRVLTLERDLKARVGEISSVTVQNPGEVRVRQWRNIDAAQGLVSLEMLLSTEPVLGTWTIVATVDGAETKKTFEVEEYVLPKFEVTVTPPSYFLVTDSMLGGKVCAQYTYGKPVRGTVDISLCLEPKYTHYYYYYGDRRPCATIVFAEIDGCYEFSVNASEIHLQDSSYRTWGLELKINATVFERGTGIVLDGSSKGPEPSYEPFSLKMEDDTSSYFKPGLPYVGRVIATYPDGSPAAGQGVEISTNQWDADILLGKNFTTDENGVVTFSISNLTSQINYLGLRARGYEYDVYQYDPERRHHVLRTPRAYNSIRPWYSPSQSYIHVDPPKQKAACGSDLNLDVYYTTPEATYYNFHYIVKSQGNIVYSGHHKHHFKRHDVPLFDVDSETELLVLPKPPIPSAPPLPPLPPTTEPTEVSANSTEEAEPEMVPVVEEIIVPEVAVPLGARRKRESEDELPEELVEDLEDIVISDHVSKLTITIPITSDMMYKARILIYYVREDGETVATSLEYDVAECFGNKVDMDFVEDSVYPGKPATLRLTADPMSLCSIGVVDKSINLLGGECSQITPKKVFKSLQEINYEPYHYYGYEDREYCEEKLKSTQNDTDEPVSYSYWYRTEGVDAVQAFRDMSLHVFSNLRVSTRKCVKERPVYRYQTYMRTGVGSVGVGVPGPAEAQLSMTDSERSEPAADLDQVEQKTQATVDLRSHFPETWLWEIEMIGETGELEMQTNIPHTITEWLGNSICTNPVSGVGISDITSIKAFQPFFISFSLPYSAVRGETIPILVTIFNYMTECLVMQVSLEENDDFVLSESESSYIECVCGGESSTLTFYITPLELGEIDILARAESLPDNGLCANTVSEQEIGVTDSVLRQIIIEAEGIEQQYTISDYVCTEGEELTRTFDLNLPDSESEFVVADSARGFINIIGDIMGPALNNLDNLVRMPYGCGEQNMASFSPNIFVLQYLTNTNQISDKIETDAKRYMMAGYQRQLGYRHGDGSYSAFGDRDPSGSTWLSAFVVKCLGQSRPYISIDEDDLTRTINWFRSKQLENGCYPQIGSVHSKYLKGGQADGVNEVSLTAFTVIALLEAGVRSNDISIQNAIHCLNAQDLTDVYTLTLVAYAHALYQPSSSTNKVLLELLLEKANFDGQQMHWSRADDEKPTPPPQRYWYHYRAPSAEVEMTAYALLTILASEEHNENMLSQAMPIVLWLSKQRNPWGGFSSTQDTVIALQALAKYATFVHQGDSVVTVQVTGSDIDSEFEVTDDNSLVLQSESVSTIPNQLEFTVNGVGCALIQANVRYNVEELDVVEPAFNIEINAYRSRLHRDDCARRTLKVCTRYLREDGKSNMAIVDVKMVTGWIPVKSTIKELLDMRTIGITKFEIDKDYVHFYFNELDGVRRCFYFDVEQNLEVSDVKPAKVTAYDYYETDLTVTKLYEIKTICGTKEELPFITEQEYEIGLFSDEIVQMRQPAMESAGRRPGLITCPKCSAEGMDATSSEYKDLICSHDNIYKSLVGRSGNYAIKIKADLKPVVKKPIDKFYHQNIDSSCNCSILAETSETGSRVLIFTSGDVLDMEEESFKFDLRTTIIPWSTVFERAARKTHCTEMP